MQMGQGGLKTDTIRYQSKISLQEFEATNKFSLS
jgi:hypothetical protein